MIGSKNLLVEDIRTDTESGVYYKYAYIRNYDGSFYQIGVLASVIQTFIDHFEYTELVNHVFSDDGANVISIINPEHIIIASSIPDYVGTTVGEEYVFDPQLGKEHKIGRMDFDGHSMDYVSVPVILDGGNHVYLVITWKADVIDSEIRNTIYQALIQLMIILLLTGGILYYAYKKDKTNIKLAYYEQLTELPNETYLKDFIAKTKSRLGTHKAILLLNLKNLPMMKMIYGSSFGNEILIQIARSIQALLDIEDGLFLNDSDQLVVVKISYSDRKELQELARQMIEVFKNPIQGKTEHQYIQAEIGIMEINDAVITIDKVLQNAQLVLSSLKQDYDNSIVFFKDEMEAIIRREDRLEKVIRAIINGTDKESFSLHFQPELDIKKQKIIGFEALARMRLEDLGYIPPLEFIDIAERRVLIYGLGKVILHKACEFVKELKDKGHHDLIVAVNISGAQLLREEFLEDVRQIVDLYDIDIHNLEFEITESVLIENFDLINQKLETIKQMGISISLDDFGTGYSSFARLKELHIDTVKIDRSFIRKIKDEHDKHAITGDIISLAHKIGLNVVAEGVEESHHYAYLEKNDCDYIQGYYLSKPLARQQALEFLVQYKPLV